MNTMFSNTSGYLYRKRYVPSSFGIFTVVIIRFLLGFRVTLYFIVTIG